MPPSRDRTARHRSVARRYSLTISDQRLECQNAHVSGTRGSDPKRRRLRTALLAADQVPVQALNSSLRRAIATDVWTTWLRWGGLLPHLGEVLPLADDALDESLAQEMVDLVEGMEWSELETVPDEWRQRAAADPRMLKLSERQQDGVFHNALERRRRDIAIRRRRYERFAIETLGHLPSPPARDYLVARLTDANPIVPREFVIDALGRTAPTTDHEVVTMLVAMLREHQGPSPRAVAQALNRINPDLDLVREGLNEVLRSGSALQRCAAVQILSELGADPAMLVQPLLALVEEGDIDDAAWLRVIATLHQVGMSPDDLDTLILRLPFTVLADPNVPDERLRRYPSSCLDFLSPQRTNVAALINGLMTELAEGRGSRPWDDALIRAIRFDRRSGDELVGYLKDPHHRVREAAARILLDARYGRRDELIETLVECLGDNSEIEPLARHLSFDEVTAFCQRRIAERQRRVDDARLLHDPAFVLLALVVRKWPQVSRSLETELIALTADPAVEDVSEYTLKGLAALMAGVETARVRLESVIRRRLAASLSTWSADATQPDTDAIKSATVLCEALAKVDGLDADTLDLLCAVTADESLRPVSAPLVALRLASSRALLADRPDLARDAIRRGIDEGMLTVPTRSLFQPSSFPLGLIAEIAASNDAIGDQLMKLIDDPSNYDVRPSGQATLTWKAALLALVAGIRPDVRDQLLDRISTPADTNARTLAIADRVIRNIPG